jgi:hypothetical protein
MHGRRRPAQRSAGGHRNGSLRPGRQWNLRRFKELMDGGVLLFGGARDDFGGPATMARWSRSSACAGVGPSSG